MAFDLDSCPNGWEPFESRSGLSLAGRTIVGAGAGERDELDRPLTSRSVGDWGGEERHVLQERSMPRHTHNYTVYFRNGQRGSGGTAIGAAASDGDNRTYTSSPTGGGEAHNNMPPFLVLLYCKKS